MKKIPISTLFILLAIPFVLVTGVMMIQSRPPAGVPSCYKNIVCDTSHILNDEQVKQLEEYHGILLDQYGIDLRVLVSNMNAASTMSFFKAAAVGGKNNKTGALFMIDPQSALIRFHTSVGIRTIYTDQFTSYVEAQQMMPFFKNNQVSLGIVETAKIIALRAQDAHQGKDFDIASYETSRKNWAIASAENKAVAPSVVDPLRSPNIQRPAEIVSEYQRTLIMGNASYDLPIYSRRSKSLRQQQPLTSQQISAEIASRNGCEIYKEVILEQGLAVLLYNVNQRQCAPYFLVFEDGSWRMDLLAGNNHILIDPKKREWRLDMTRPFLYADALLDWQFDKDGVPHPMPKMRWGLLVDSDLAARVTFIKKIYDNATATKMPLQEKDVILEWDGIKNPTHADVEKSMVDSDPGKKLTILLWRKGQRLTVEIEVPPRLDP